MSCKGICIRHKADKIANKLRYANGQKRCQICDIFIRWNGLYCPCCGFRLRTRPRGMKYRDKFRAYSGKIFRFPELTRGSIN